MPRLLLLNQLNKEFKVCCSFSLKKFDIFLIDDWICSSLLCVCVSLLKGNAWIFSQRWKIGQHFHYFWLKKTRSRKKRSFCWNRKWVLTIWMPSNLTKLYMAITHSLMHSFGNLFISSFVSFSSFASPFPFSPKPLF